MSRPPSEPAVTQHRSANEILQLGLAYDGMVGKGLAHFGDGAVSLPSWDRHPVVRSGIISGSPLRYLEDFESWLLKDDDDIANEIDHFISIQPYMDPPLRRKDNYVSIVVSLVKARIISWTRRPRGYVTAFFRQEEKQQAQAGSRLSAS